MEEAAETQGGAEVKSIPGNLMSLLNSLLTSRGAGQNQTEHHQRGAEDQHGQTGPTGSHVGQPGFMRRQSLQRRNINTHNRKRATNPVFDAAPYVKK